MRWAFSLAALSVLLVAASPAVFPSVPSPSLLLVGMASLSFPLILWGYIWGNPVRGLVTVLVLTLVGGFVALSSENPALRWFALELLVFGGMTHAGVAHRRQRLQEQSLLCDHLEVQLNTLRDQIRQEQRSETSHQKQVFRYNKLQEVANTFQLSLPLDELAPCIAHAVGETVAGADHVLLYLVDPQALELELKAVWHRSTAPTIRAKRGDAFDHWVMRQGQPLLVQEPQHDFRFPKMTEDQLGRPLGGLLAVPLVSKHRFLGVLRLESNQPRRLGPDELRLVRIIGDMASLAVENSLLYSRTAQLAMTDDLTKLLVHGYFDQRFQQELSRSETEGTPLALLIIDIDRFKAYNDQFGHSAGDKLLSKVGELLGQVRRAGDVMARYGGEEFVVLIPGVGAGEAIQRAEEIRSQVEGISVTLRRIPTCATASIGVATFPKDGRSARELMQAADRRLYQAKALGRNRVCHL